MQRVSSGTLRDTRAARTHVRWIAAAWFALACLFAPAIASAEPAVPVFRFFNNQTGTHFFTTSTIERDIVLSRWPQFMYEGAVFYAYLNPVAGTKPVYRFFDTSTGTHFYTQSETERDQTLATMPTYLFEGAVYYEPSALGSGNTALYRFYNVNTRSRFYTASAAERDAVLSHWPQFHLEGVAYYVWTTPSPPGSSTPTDISVKLTASGSGSAVTLLADASDGSAAISSVEFRMDGVSIGSVSRAPYLLKLTVPAGTHIFTAVVHDAAGQSQASEPASYTYTDPSAVEPKITLAVSAPSISLGQQVTLTATASEDGGSIAKVSFFANGALIGESSAAPYTVVHTPATEGTVAYSATATDAKGVSKTSATIGVTVTSGSTPAVTPKVSVTADPKTITFGETTKLTATATEDGGTIARVEFFASGKSIGKLASAPYVLVYKPDVAGSLSITAVATDAKGYTGTSSAVGVTVNPVAGATPKITLSSSASTVNIGDTITLTASASEDGGGIKKVGFYSVNGASTKLLAEVSTAPYIYRYVPGAGGTLSFTARATDVKNVTADSSAVGVTVRPAATTPVKASISASNPYPQVGTVVTLTASVSTVAPATIAKVEFLRDGAVFATVTKSPFTTTSTESTAGAKRAYTARATDSNNANATSTPVNVVTTAVPAMPSSVDLDAWRLLTQATFGPTAAELARVASLGGPSKWIDDQFNQPVSAYPDSRYNRLQTRSSYDCASSDPAGNGYAASSPQAKCVRDHLTLTMVQRDFFTNAVNKPDQLRQRVAWALSQILVTSAMENDLSYAYVMARYQDILFNNAFGNYQTLLQQVTLSPAMGNYLDAVNNDRPDGKGRVPNENYAREIMQLFSIGLVALNQDGTVLGDPMDPTPTYDQDDIKEMARVFTGWTYPRSDGAATTGKNAAYYASPMVPFPGSATTGHDPDAKLLFDGDTTIPAGGTAQGDMLAAVNAVFMHPNTPPFVSKQLIQKLVTGNPSPAYVKRVADKFVNDGAGNRGNLKAVVKAILMDPEARGTSGDAGTRGTLREPVMVITSLVRALSGITDGGTLSNLTDPLGQRVYYSPTVFNYFLPDTLIVAGGSSLNEPEFGIHDSNTAVGRANLVYRLVYQGVGQDANLDGSTGTRLNTQQFETFAADPATLVDKVAMVLTGNALPAGARATVATAVSAINATNVTDRARMAVYLVASSYYYQVQR